MLGGKSLVGLDAKRDLEVMGLGEWYEQTRRVHSNLPIFEDGLDELFIQLGES